MLLLRNISVLKGLNSEYCDDVHNRMTYCCEQKYQSPDTNISGPNTVLTLLPFP